jgi:phosphatidate cytidylyltransferase
MGKMQDLKRRIGVAFVAITLVTSLIFLSHLPLVNWILVLTVAGLAGVGVWEYANLAKAKGLNPASNMMIFFAVLEVIGFYISLAYPDLSKVALLIMVCGFISFFAVHFKNPTNALLQVATELCGVCYLAIPFSFMLAILHPLALGSDLQHGRYWLFYLIMTTKVTDIGGYFIGKLFGKHPLAPLLSPNKTVEGALGGLIFAMALSSAMSYLSCYFQIDSFNLNPFDAVWMGLIIGVLAQIGDLAESMLKRDAVVKDSNTLPGLGGVLDMVDSLIFTSPVVYFFIRS